MLPIGWALAPPGAVDVLYSLQLAPPDILSPQPEYRLYYNADLVAQAPDRAAAFVALREQSEWLAALQARGSLFVHAGVVGWNGRAIVIPGRSMSGKSTLVKALIQAGATYYSDEFAVLDDAGQVHPYPLPLSLRTAAGQPGCHTTAEELGARVGETPLPVGLVVVTRYQPRARWRPIPLPASQALLALMDNTVAARREPSYSMPILRATILGATVVTSKRGDARAVARAILHQLAA